MKYHISVLLIVIAVLIGCTEYEEGPVGPKGLNGTDGTDGLVTYITNIIHLTNTLEVGTNFMFTIQSNNYTNFGDAINWIYVKNHYIDTSAKITTYLKKTNKIYWYLPGWGTGILNDMYLMSDASYSHIGEELLVIIEQK